MNASKFRQLERDIAQIRDYAVENPMASPINVVYFFRDVLNRALWAENGYDKPRFVAAFRNQHSDEITAQKELLSKDLNSELENL